MKVKYIILIVFVIILSIFIIYFITRKEKIEITNIHAFHLSYTKGYSINASINYELDYNKDSGKYFVNIKPYDVSDDDKLEMDVDIDIKEKLENILKKYHVEKWNGFKKYDNNVLDGDSFHLYIKMDDEKTIEADGYMKWPENYSSVIRELDELFMKIYNDNKK